MGRTVVGLTGGICAGKSTVGSFLQSEGFTVIDCDKLGHKTYLPGTETFKQLVATFGEELVDAEGQINRKVLGGKVFGKPEEMKKLTDIVWPGIRHLIEEELAQATGVVFVEAAVLFEVCTLYLLLCLLVFHISPPPQTKYPTLLFLL